MPDEDGGCLSTLFHYTTRSPEQWNQIAPGNFVTNDGTLSAIAAHSIFRLHQHPLWIVEICYKSDEEMAYPVTHPYEQFPGVWEYYLPKGSPPDSVINVRKL